MSLDLFTVTVMTALVAGVASVTFIVETVFRRDSGPGRLWAVAFFCGVTTTLAYMAWSAGVGGAIPIAVGNTLFILVPGFMWLGNRRYNDRSIRAAVICVGALAAVAFVVVLVEGPGPGGWGGWGVMAAGLVALFLAAAIETLRPPLRNLRSAWTLSAVLIAASLFYGARLVAFLADGPDGDVFVTWFGPVPANLCTVILTVVAAIVMSVLRSHRSGQRRFEWLTQGGVAADGVMLARTFAGASADILERSSWRADGVSLIVIRVEGLDEIRRAFGTEIADDISRACRGAVRRYAPASAIVGEDAEDRLAVCTSATTIADARRLGATIYRGCTDELSEADSGLFPFVGVGVAVTADTGYDFTALLSAAREAARRAAETPGSSVLLGAVDPRA